eukprot:12399079-Karenia_brevis.AAC.1
MESTTICDQKCVKFKAERSRRNRIWHASRRDELKMDSYCDAPVLYSFNIPQYFTMLLRAQHYARQLTWCYVRDTPIEDGDISLSHEALNSKFLSSLAMH